MTKALIVDDEPLARSIIEKYLDRIPNWEVAGTCINGEEAYDALLKYDIDVIFLDIQMPVVSGVDFLQSLLNPPLVIFTTAYSDYAIKGFDLNVVDYLLKPINFSRFIQAIEKADKRLTSDEKALKGQDEQINFVFFKNKGKLVKVAFSDIEYIKAEQEYSMIITKLEKLLVSMHLKKVQELLPEYLFTRIHRSYIIPHEKIDTIYGNMVIIGDHEKIPIGTNYKKNLLRKLNIN